MTTSPTKTPTPPAPLSIAGVSAKLPSFCPSDVELWFCLCEAEFDNCSITRQDTHFGHIARSLPPEVVQEVCDLIVSRPMTNPYDELKATVIKRTSVSEQRRLRQLLNEEDLGDRKPTQLLRRMRLLLGVRKFEEALLRQCFCSACRATRSQFWLLRRPDRRRRHPDRIPIFSIALIAWG